MSDGDVLRAAIRADPTDTTVRLVFADWLDENDQPGGDLIRVLVGAPFVGAAVGQVIEWFHHRHGWPELFNPRTWVLEVLEPRWWPDPERLRECILLIAERMRPLAERDPHHDDSRRIIEAAAFLDREGLDHALLISNSAASVAARYLSCYGDTAGSAGNMECCEQSHVIAWTWLNLPPLPPPPEPLAPPELPALPEPPPDPARSWWRRLFGG